MSTSPDDLAKERARQHAIDQALASTRIEGHVPTPEFIEECRKLAAGEMSDEDMLAESLRRARELDAKATKGGAR